MLPGLGGTGEMEGEIFGLEIALLKVCIRITIYFAVASGTCRTSPA